MTVGLRVGVGAGLGVETELPLIPQTVTQPVVLSPPAVLTLRLVHGTASTDTIPQGSPLRWTQLVLVASAIVVDVDISPSSAPIIRLLSEADFFPTDREVALKN